FESLMTLSGANADKRVPVTPAQQKEVMKALASNSANLPENVKEAVDNAKRQLQRAGSKAVVVCGLMDVEAQTLALEINENIGTEVADTTQPRLIRQGNTQEVLNVIRGVQSGAVKGLITVGIDPLYSFPDADGFAEAYQNLEFTLAFTMRQDATASQAQFVAATPHYLESWGDIQIKKGHFALSQPTIRPLFNTKQFQDCVLTWLGEEKSYYDYIKETINPLLEEKSWNEALHDGVFESAVTADVETSGTLTAVSSNGALSNSTTSEGDFDLIFYTKTAMGDGQNANNP